MRKEKLKGRWGKEKIKRWGMEKRIKGKVELKGGNEGNE